MLRVQKPTKAELKTIEAQLSKFPGQSPRARRGNLGLIRAGIACGRRGREISADLDHLKGDKIRLERWLTKFKLSLDAIPLRNLPMLADGDVEKFRVHAPKPRGIPRVDDRRIVSGIYFKMGTGCRWSDIPKAYGPSKTIYNRFNRWTRHGVISNAIEDRLGPGSSTK